MADIRAAIGLEPKDAVEFFRSKGTYPLSRHWTDVWQEEHGRAFTVAKMMDRSLLEQVRASLDQVIAHGGTFEQWKTGIQPQLERAGWWGKVENSDLTGVSWPVFVGPARLQTIYNTNLRMARAAGKWKRIQALKGVAPYLRYSAILDGRTRPMHRLWHGTILPVDHPWWNTHFPPCGWNCRCTVVQLSERDLKARGWSVTAEPKQGPAQRFRKADGTIVQVPAGIDPGFDYNPGAHHLRGLVPPPAEGPIDAPHVRPVDLPPLPAVPPKHRITSADTLDPDTISDADAVKRFLDSFGGLRSPDGTVITKDVTGEPLVLDDSFFVRAPTSPIAGRSKLKDDRKRLILQLAQALIDPDEIWSDWTDVPQRDGTVTRRVTRRYLARFIIDDDEIPLIIALQIDPSGWKGLTAYPGKSMDYAQGERVRGGWLVYRRN